jgi:hypothetical protein
MKMNIKVIVMMRDGLLNVISIRYDGYCKSKDDLSCCCQACLGGAYLPNWNASSHTPFSSMGSVHLSTVRG